MTLPSAEAAARIAARIVHALGAKAEARRWEALLSSPAAASVAKGASLWQGVAGIALFLAEAHRCPGGDRLLGAAEDGARWCLERRGGLLDESRPGGLFDGALGVAFLLCRLTDLTGDATWARRAGELALEATRRLPAECDLFDGLAGVVVGLAHVEARTGDRRIARRRHEALGRLLERTRVHGDGLFWDLHAGWRLPLCGFAHGGAGVAFALAEQGRGRTGSGVGALAGVVRGALEYEDAHYDRARAGWPDFRRPDPEGELMNAWCHGVAGCGLARSHLARRGLPVSTPLDDLAQRCRGDLALLDDPRRADVSLTLCHGLGGAVELLLHLDLGSAPDLAARLVRTVNAQLGAHGALRPGYRAPEGADHSLFLGEAGVGHLLLRATFPDRVPSVLLPALPAEAELEPVEPGWVADRLDRAFFPRTAARAPGRSAVPDRPSDAREEGLPEAARGRLLRRIDGLESDARERLVDLQALEWAGVQAFRSVRRFEAEAEDPTPGGGGAPGLPPADRRVAASGSLHVHTARWAWGTGEGVTSGALPEDPPGRHPVALMPRRSGCVEVPLGPVGASLLSRLREPTPVGRLLASFPSGKDRRLAGALLRRGLDSGLLEVVEDRPGDSRIWWDPTQGAPHGSAPQSNRRR